MFPFGLAEAKYSIFFYLRSHHHHTPWRCMMTLRGSHAIMCIMPKAAEVEYGPTVVVVDGCTPTQRTNWKQDHAIRRYVLMCAVNCNIAIYSSGTNGGPLLDREIVRSWGDRGNHDSPAKRLFKTLKTLEMDLHPALLWALRHRPGRHVPTIAAADCCVY